MLLFTSFIFLFIYFYVCVWILFIIVSSSTASGLVLSYLAIFYLIFVIYLSNPSLIFFIFLKFSSNYSIFVFVYYGYVLLIFWILISCNLLSMVVSIFFITFSNRLSVYSSFFALSFISFIYFLNFCYRFVIFSF